MRFRLFLCALLLLAGLSARGQIVNRLKVDAPTFERYAYGRMQQYAPSNLQLADSLYAEGVRSGNDKYKCLALSLEFPVRFAEGDYARMDAAVAELKSLLDGRKDVRAFYFQTLHEYCQYLVHIGRSSDAMLEARAMRRLAEEEKRPLGKMYAFRIIGLIQSYRENGHLSIRNFLQAARYCQEAHAEQDLPNLYILVAQEYIRMKHFPEAEQYCARAEAYQDFFPLIRTKALITRACLYNAQEDWAAFWETYDRLNADPLYAVQADRDERFALDVNYLRSRGMLQEALSRADSLSTPKDRYAYKHGLYADMGAYDSAYDQLGQLVEEKDSTYIKVQNEDLAILDAEMNNADLRAQAQQLRHQNQNTILIGFIVMFAIAFLSILVAQWQLRENLDEMKRKNGEILRARRAYQQALDAKEAENAVKIRILQSRKSNTVRL